MKTKSVQQVMPPVRTHMVGDGFKVHNFFPSGYPIGSKRMSPFFLMDYGAKFHVPPGNRQRGVGPHPHRGFETVTIAYHGKVAHHDSMGNSGVIGEGDVQWMTAGSGILHKEYHEKEFSQMGGPMQMVQLWVNLPAKHKMTAPKYQGLTRDQMGRFDLPEEAGTVEVIAGEYRGVKGPGYSFTPVHMYNVRLKQGASVELDLLAGYNTGMLVLEGAARINGADQAPADHFVLFKNDGETIRLEAEQDGVFLVLSGEPIDEPVASYGPFVMNTEQELQEAVADFNQGKFGRLED